MKIIYTILLIFISSFYIYAQQQLFYVCIGGTNQGILKLNITTCDSSYIGYTDSVVLTDIAITSDHSLYGIDGEYLYQIDTSNAHLTKICNLNVLNSQLAGINALVADSAGNLLTVGNSDSLYQINRFTGQPVTLGYIGYGSGGDLTFYNDTLYLAGGNCCIALIKIVLHPTLSAQLIDTFNTSLAIFGLNTICINNVETMIATGGHGSYSNLYQVNPANANLTLLCDTIIHALIDGAASIYDINGSEAGCSIISGVKENLFNNRVVIWPNPFSTEVSINIPIDFAQIKIYDLTGNLLLSASGNEDAINRSLNTISMNLPNGVYILKVETPDGSDFVNKKFIKM